MTTNLRPDARLGPTIYRDALHVYLEFPAIPPASPVAVRFDLTHDGLAKLLKHIPTIPSVGHVTGAGNLVADKLLPKAKVAKATKRQREEAKFSPEARASAANIIRNLRTKP